jgi:hypothetical protein
MHGTKRRQRVPRPCDGAPKDGLSWEPSSWTSRGPCRSRRRAWRVGPAGVGEQGVGTQGFLGNLGGPELPPCVLSRLWGPGDEPQARGWATWTAGSETTGATQGIVGRRQPSPARGAQGVAQRHSTVEAGELASEDPVEERALPTGGPSGGNQAEPSEASSPVTVILLDSVRGARSASAEVSRPRCQPVR